MAVRIPRVTLCGYLCLLKWFPFLERLKQMAQMRRCTELWWKSAVRLTKHRPNPKEVWGLPFQVGELINLIINRFLKQGSKVTGNPCFWKESHKNPHLVSGLWDTLLSLLWAVGQGGSEQSVQRQTTVTYACSAFTVCAHFSNTLKMWFPWLCGELVTERLGWKLGEVDSQAFCPSCKLTSF